MVETDVKSIPPTHMHVCIKYNPYKNNTYRKTNNKKHKM
jgi:hypothetical protein